MKQIMSVMDEQKEALATQKEALVELNEGLVALTEALRNNQLQIDKVVEIQNVCFQKLQMCVPMNCSMQIQGESIWDDESTLNQDDEVTFELYHDEQEEMITKEIKEVSKTKIEFIDIKDDEVQSHSTQFQDELDEKTISFLKLHGMKMKMSYQKVTMHMFHYLLW